MRVHILPHRHLEIDAELLVETQDNIGVVYHNARRWVRGGSSYALDVPAQLLREVREEIEMEIDPRWLGGKSVLPIAPLACYALRLQRVKGVQ